MVRVKYGECGDLGTAIEESIRECESRGILKDFLKEHGGDVMSFLFDKMSREECEAVREADGYEKGKAEGEKLGETRGIQAVAVNMLEMDIDIPTIARATGLSEDEVRDLKNLK